MVGAGVHRLDLEHRVEHDVERLPAADRVAAGLPGDHHHPGAGVDVVGELLDDRLEPAEQVLLLVPDAGPFLVEALERLEVELLAPRDRRGARPLAGLLDEFPGPLRALFTLAIAMPQ